MKESNSSQKRQQTNLFNNIFIAFGIFFIVSIAMLISSKVFSLQSYISSPQFGFDNVNFISLIIHFKQYGGYKMFFIFDMLFMLSICWLVYNVFERVSQEEYIYPKKKFFKVSLIVLGLLSVLFDIWENSIYLGLLPLISWVERVNRISIGLFLLVLAYFLMINFGISNWKRLWRILKSSFLSILIIVIIGLGLTFLPQGATLIVHLIDAPKVSNVVNLILTILFVNMLAIIISHFPTYFDFAFNKWNKKGQIKWNLTNICCGIGFITYNYKEKFVLWKKFLRHFLGILMFAAWFYVIYKAFDIYQITLMNSLKATFIVTLGVSFLYFFLLKKSQEAKDKFFENLYNQKSKDNFKEIQSWSNWFIILLIGTILFGLLWLSITFLFGWEKTNLRIYFMFAFLNVLTYMLFRLTRSMWVFAWGDKKVIKTIIKIDHKQLSSSLNYLLQHKLFINTPLSKINIKYYFTRLSSNVNYLKFLRGGGLFALLFLVLTNVMLGSGKDVTYFSSIPILLAFIIVLYSIITISIKHIIYYRKHKNKNHFIFIDQKWKAPKKTLVYKKWFSPVVISIFIALIVLFSIFKQSFNIHKLSFVDSVPQAPQNISLEDFSISLKKNIKTKKIKRLAKVASFGGGMKSNLWNLLVMDTITSSFSSSSYFMDRCISLSGVSGGAVGLGNYLALDYLHRDNKALLKTKIDEIGNANILAIDMAGILIHDWVRDLFHIDNNDRAYFAMKKYREIIEKNTENTTFFQKSQRNVWSEMYRKHKYIPALIINTAATGLKPGVAFSMDQGSYNIFPGYLYLSERDKDLKYYDAISTSNRFPIMSPAAQVEDKGFFLDGGYFENSGLLTSSFLNKYLNDKKVFIDNNDTIATLTINIINGRGNYIKRFIVDNKLKVDELNYSTNLKSIIKGITDIDKLPNVLHQSEKEYKINGDSLCEIYLPHWITVDDISQALEGKIDINEKLLDLISKNNDKIRNALADFGVSKSKGIVEPPLSRTLSSPAVEYQKAMIKHHVDCKKQIQVIKDYLSPTKVPVIPQ